MNRMLITMGYGCTYLLPEMSPADMGTMLSILMRAQRVESSGYGEDRKVYASGVNGFSIESIPREMVVADDPVQSLRAKLEDAERQLKQRTEWWTTEKKRADELAKNAANQDPGATTVVAA